jgi:hypothetical protein
MPRYYFFVQQEGHLVAADDEGVDLSGPDAAQEEASKAARELLAECIRSGEDSPVEAVVVTDHEGHPLSVLRMTQVLPKGLRNRIGLSRRRTKGDPQP